MRAGALGDVILLRTAVAALRESGHSVSLLAPSHAGAALLGHGPCEVDSVLPWESATFAGLLTDDANVAQQFLDSTGGRAAVGTLLDRAVDIWARINR